MIFVDTGPFVARWLGADQHHDESVAAWRRLAEEGARCATSQHVVDETLTLLARRASGSFAAEKGRSILTSRALEVLRTTAAEEHAALPLLERYSDLRLSFTDCLSFELMRRHSIERAFTFDHHFRVAGFQVWPGPS